MSVKKWFNLTGLTAIVTGVGCGLGSLMAPALLEAGSKVVLCDYGTGQIFVVDGAFGLRK